MNFSRLRNTAVLLLLATGIISCGKKDAPSPVPRDSSDVEPPTVTFDINSINDTYEDVAPFVYYPKWGPYNVHDPVIRKFGDYYYCYSTDVGYGISVRPGIQVRKSKDLVEWIYVGWVFDNIPSQGSSFIQQRSGTPNNSLWAPSVLKVGSEYRLYYSLASNVGRLSVIGLATASSPEGPWTEKGLVVTSLNDNSIQTNAIDPSVLVTPSGEHWMYYGSAWDGIYALKLDPATGLAQTSNDKGRRIANRGFTNGRYNGNIEGPEVVYNASLNKYFLFIAYDWLETKYNTRVMHGDKPDGPFYDFKGADANTAIDHGPMITAPYQFNGHSGWQGVAHCTVFDDGNGQYYLAHQGRPGINKYFMDLHVRKVFWTNDGWPVVSPERYAREDNANVPVDSITGSWEQIILGYRVVPGYADEQVSPDFQVSIPLTISANGTLNNDAGSKWVYNAPWLEMRWSNGYTDKVLVQRGRDWEKKTPGLIFTGLNNDGVAIWGKKNKQ